MLELLLLPLYQFDALRLLSAVVADIAAIAGVVVVLCYCCCCCFFVFDVAATLTLLMHTHAPYCRSVATADNSAVTA
jgi:hypothetical protein